VAGSATVLQCELPTEPTLHPPLPAVSPPDRVETVTSPLPAEVPARSIAPWYRRRWVWATVGASLVAGAIITYVAWPSLPDSDGGVHRFP